MYDHDHDDHDQDDRASYYDHDGRPSPPLEFPAPRVDEAVRRVATVHDPVTGVARRRSVLHRAPERGRLPSRGYVVLDRVGGTAYGSVRLCRVVERRRRRRRRPRSDEEEDTPREYDDDDDDASRTRDRSWVETDRLVVLRTAAWSRVLRADADDDDPFREIAASQLLGDYHPHVGGTLDVLEDDRHLYVVASYCANGTLRDAASRERAVLGRVSEARARTWFRQLLSALRHLQMKGVCHGALSLESVGARDGGDRLVLLDFGASVRVPFADPVNEGGVVDASEGVARRPMAPRRGRRAAARRPPYAAPELAHGGAYDGFAVDLWAVAVVLHALLVGTFPFPDGTHPGDARLREELERSTTLDENARDLLRCMLREDPRRRPSLSAVTAHPWVVGKSSSPSRGTRVVANDAPATTKFRGRKRSWYGAIKRVWSTAEHAYSRRLIV